MDESDIPEVVRKARESGGRESEAAYIRVRSLRSQIEHLQRRLRSVGAAQIERYQDLATAVREYVEADGSITDERMVAALKSLKKMPVTERGAT